ncbi:restriction endonuclease subunit S [Vibrio splendidus]|uniref:restriction endonuclease subunit S n=1 Tax=Vibrio splendidus TaxID=29497 RepID=UPI00148E561D|nr:restriction endonuclease subunit S [Vibrio splendidus]NOJ08293.1 restriction endonuclease subunit S [Vibrio splendidus]
MRLRLSEVADIHAGYPFRGSIKHDPNASVQVVQAKDISDLGELQSAELVRTELTGKKQPMWLEQGDVLFIAKGMRTYAAYVPEQLEDVISSPSLFQIRIKSSQRDKINPMFLAWQLNQKPVQQYFRKSAEGSTQTNIRKPVLADVELAIPDIEKQNTIAKLYAASIKENALLHKLINNRQQQLDAIATDLIQNSEQFKG